MERAATEFRWLLFCAHFTFPYRVAAVNAPGAESAKASFNKIKALIIKSADIVDAYSTQIRKQLDGAYAAQSEFADYTERTTHTIEQNHKYTTDTFSSIHQITGKVPEIENYVLTTKSYIKTGELFHVGDPGISLGKDRLPEGAAVSGVAVGELVKDGTDAFFQYAMFTPYGLALYDENGIESAYITDRKLYIPQANIVISLTIGGYADMVDANGGIVTRWIKNEQEA